MSFAALIACSAPPLPRDPAPWPIPPGSLMHDAAYLQGPDYQNRILADSMKRLNPGAKASDITR